ncbi:MAG: PspC domain-containing protein [Prevotellaceae bacterium]|jgi:phage shock protein PspC (stress-responsive transcriptional regulator)|nr:PspC domain-containing protein [Prevotellaceae bacterium]
MKKVISVNVGGICFIIEIDAYEILKDYLDDFEASLEKNDAKEIMEDVEMRIAEIFQETIKSTERVVNENLVNRAISILGKPEKNGNAKSGKQQADNSFSKTIGKIEDKFNNFRQKHQRFYRDPDGKKIAGICSGIAEYFDFDVTIVRFVALILVFTGFAIIIYIILWIVTPEALSSVQKLELRGLPITSENIKKYPATENNKRK